MVSFSVVVCFVVLTVTAATNVEQCKGRNLQNLSDNVELIPCSKVPCKLKKGTEEKVSIGFTPEKEVESVTNRVTAEVFNLPLPFVGVDGVNICDKIYTEDGKATGCPLKAGTKYWYKDSFPIYAIYPELKVTVHWELLDKENISLACFEVGAKITNK